MSAKAAGNGDTSASAAQTCAQAGLTPNYTRKPAIHKVTTCRIAQGATPRATPLPMHCSSGCTGSLTVHTAAPGYCCCCTCYRSSCFGGSGPNSRHSVLKSVTPSGAIADSASAAPSASACATCRAAKLSTVIWRNCSARVAVFQPASTGLSAHRDMLRPPTSWSTHPLPTGAA